MLKLSELKNKCPIGLIVTFLITGIISLSPVCQSVDDKIFDNFLRLKTSLVKTELSSKVVPVLITDNTVADYSKGLENRQAFVDFMSVLSNLKQEGAKFTTGFDILFSEDKNEDETNEFAKLIQNCGDVVIPCVPLTKEETNFSGQKFSESEKELLEPFLYHLFCEKESAVYSTEKMIFSNENVTKSAAGLAHVGIQVESDGVYRKVPLFYKTTEGFVPSLSLACFINFNKISFEQIKIFPGKKIIIPVNGKQLSIPVDKNCCTYVTYPDVWKNSHKVISFETIIEAANNQDIFYELLDYFDNSVLLVGDASTLQKDIGISPLETVYPLCGLHTSLLNGMFTNGFYKTFPFVFKLIFLILVLIITFLIRNNQKNVTLHLLFLLEFLGVIAISILFFCTMNMLPWCFGIILCVVSLWLYTFIERLIFSYRDTVLMQNALSQYFPKALALRIMKEKKTDLKPAKKDLTMLFSDICSFTKWSSNKKPEDVHAFLTDYLSSMAEIIFNNGGTIDKFIGDGILAFFGDPVEQEDRTERAVHCAIQMQTKIRQLAVKWKPIVDINLKVRVGINSGEVIVGNLGTKFRIDYTVIGAPVNLASRMESNAPQGGILLSEHAWESVKDKFDFEESIQVSAKGYDVPVNAYPVDLSFLE